MMITTNEHVQNSFETIRQSELARIHGGVAPLIIGLGIVGSLGGGFGGGYVLSRVFG